MIYLDYNATAPILPEVADCMREVMRRPCNPSSVHASGRKAKQQMEAARTQIAQILSVFTNEIIFTASGSESNNLALRACADRPVFVGATEHASVLQTGLRLGADVLPVDARGLIDLAILESRLASLGRPALLSVMLLNNETGIIQPVAEIAALAKRFDALVHCDAVQAFGKIPVDFGLLGVDMMTLCGHKCGGPVGGGILIVRNELPIKPLITGGRQEMGRRAGTENVPVIVGLAKAFELASQRQWVVGMQRAMAQMEATICETAGSNVVVGHESPRSGTTSCILMPGVSSETQLMTFDLEGYAVSAGSACSSGRIEPSHVLLAMGLAQKEAGCAIRVSVGWQSTPEEIMSFTGVWQNTYKRLAQKVA